MIYLIGQLSLWLLLTAAFAAVAGWAFAAERSARDEHALQRDRQKLLRDIIKLASDGGGVSGDDVEGERENDANRRLLELRDARIAELEQAAEAARARVNDAAGQIAELERRVAHGGSNGEELIRLRAQVADLEEEKRREIPETPVVDVAAEEANALQSWRLRYFEQRVRYLEGLSRSEPKLEAAPVNTQPLEWRLRDAEAQVAYLEGALREAAAPVAGVAPPAEEDEAPFAANADVDVLLRWRLLYLERRVGYLQEELAQEAVAPAPAPEAEPNTSEDPDRWKWRARYLEARMRHLEERPAAHAPVQALASAPATDEEKREPVSPPATSRRGAKPPVLPAPHHGAPDDLTLIEGVSLLQQTTLYSLGVFHFEQIAAWTPDNVAWVDNYLRLRGRIDEEEWVEQAAELAEGIPSRSFDEAK